MQMRAIKAKPLFDGLSAGIVSLQALPRQFEKTIPAYSGFVVT